MPFLISFFTLALFPLPHTFPYFISAGILLWTCSRSYFINDYLDLGNPCLLMTKGCDQKWLVILQELSEAFELFIILFMERARMMEIAQWMEEYAAIFPQKFPWQKEGNRSVPRLPIFHRPVTLQSSLLYFLQSHVSPSCFFTQV